MISSSYLRTLLGAGLCCIPLLAATAAESTSALSASSGAVTGVPVTPLRVELACDSAGMLLAAAPSNPPSSRLNTLNRQAVKIDGDVSFAADHMINDLPNNQTELTGNVDVHVADREIQADQLIYDANAMSMSVSGQVRYRDPTVELQGDTGQYSDDGALFNHAQFQFLKLPGYGSADEISETPANVVTLRNVTYTTCPRPKADWMLHARELRFDTQAGIGVGRGAILDFQGVPILYVPWISFPLSDQRKSGFLFPEFSTSSRTGVLLSAPWYWNIAPNQDATFTPKYYSLRGLDAGVEYRYLSSINTGSMLADYLNNDKEYAHEVYLQNCTGSDPSANCGHVGGADRSYLRILDRLQLPANTRLDTNIQYVSDDEYFEDFTSGAQSTSTAFLPRNVLLSHRDDIWNLRGEFLGYQTVDGTLPDYQHPYLQLPRLSAAGTWSPASWPQLNLGFDSELSNFSRDCHAMSAAQLSELYTSNGVNTSDLCPPTQAVNGWRLDARPQIGMDISGAGYFLRPNVSWEYTQYELRDIDLPGGGAFGAEFPCAEEASRTQFDLGDYHYCEDGPSRSLPIVSLDAGLQFERFTGPNDVRLMTLEPRLMYVYIPYRDQNQLPVFDTAPPDLNLIELFRPNRYVGLDRIGDANELTMGVTTQMFESASGVRYLSATLGQAVFFQPPKVTLPDATGDVGPSTSSLIAETNLTAYRNWNLQVNVASNPAVTRVEEAEAVLQYLISSKQVANLSYRYLYGQLEQVDGSEAWNVGGHWDVYARSVYSLHDHHPIQNFAGFQYRGSCWSMRLVAQRSVTTRTGEQDTGVAIQVELTGLSNVGNGIGTGSGVTTFLEQSIRGYSATATKP